MAVVMVQPIMYLVTKSVDMSSIPRTTGWKE